MNEFGVGSVTHKKFNKQSVYFRKDQNTKFDSYNGKINTDFHGIFVVSVWQE